jgi:hypothetical protein
MVTSVSRVDDWRCAQGDGRQQGLLNNCFVELMAMAIEHGVPQVFVTFTANEMGWGDMTAACDGLDFGVRPVEATRHYNHRWNAFNRCYLSRGTQCLE